MTWGVYESPKKHLHLPGVSSGFGSDMLEGTSTDRPKPEPGTDGERWGPWVHGARAQKCPQCFRDQEERPTMSTNLRSMSYPDMDMRAERLPV